MLSNQCADNNFHGAFMNPAHLNYDEEKRYSAKLRPGNIFRLIPNVWFLKSKKKTYLYFTERHNPDQFPLLKPETTLEVTLIMKDQKPKLEKIMHY